MKPRQQAVEGDEAGFAGEDAVELGRKRGLALLARSALISLEIAVELPDCGADGDAVFRREGIELVDQPPLSRGSASTHHRPCWPN
jgi:hypothetical protein